MPLQLDDLLEEFGAADADIYRAVNDAAELVLARLEGADLAALGRHNLALVGYDWTGYLQASRFRVAFLAKRLRELGRAGGRLLDQGSYFGNFSLAFHRLGYEVTAADYYDAADGSLDPWRELLESSGVTVVDCGTMTDPLPHPKDSFDIAISTGVIEHIPSSPKRHLEQLVGALRPGGLLAVETPNLAYQAKRDLLAEGKSVYADIEAQFESECPFSGHHREFTAAEVEWMLDRVGIDVIGTTYVDYSYRSLAYIDDAVRAQVEHRRQDPTRQELLVCCGTRR